MDSPWSQLQTDWLQIPLPRGTTPSWEAFSERFDRCLRRVSFYVSRRVSDRQSLGRIVTRVIVENLDFFAAECDQPNELRRLRASADRILALEAATSPGAGAPSSARGHDVCAARPDESSPR
jgi:hypothetical protein